MNSGKTMFAQLVDFLPKRQFRRIVEKYNGEKSVRTFSCWDQFLCMAFAQLTYRESLRDIEVCLRALNKKLYHVGIRGKISRSTLAYANNTRNWRIFQDFANILIREAQRLYVNEPFGVDLKEAVYALDATIITLCLSVFPWARYMKDQGGIKLHTQLDLRGNIPVFIAITDAKRADVHLLDVLIPEAGAIYVMDRGYVDFQRLYKIHRALAFFVTRAKRKLSYKRVRSHQVDDSSGVCSDQTIKLRSRDSAKHYPERLRRIRYFDEEQQRFFVFLTNNFSLPAKTIADLYRCRWQIELFFKWIKQHLRIKAFYGTSLNAVKTQIWIAISIYVLVAIVKKKLKINQSLYTMLQVFSVTLFEKTSILSALQHFELQTLNKSSENQLEFFTF